MPQLVLLRPASPTVRRLLWKAGRLRWNARRLLRNAGWLLRNAGRWGCCRARRVWRAWCNGVGAERCCRTRCRAWARHRPRSAWHVEDWTYPGVRTGLKCGAGQLRRRRLPICWRLIWPLWRIRWLWRILWLCRIRLRRLRRLWWRWRWGLRRLRRRRRWRLRLQRWIL